jgi:cell division protein FtsI (penicillin-binding protein 3)/stage V sporulation protein D (sporulation-specific penicillin-binding protein)
MRKVISENGEILQENHPKVLSTPISPEVAKQMREMLALVVLEGTGRRAKIPGYTIAGKTGTAEIVRPDGGYYKHNHWTSFIGFIPVDKPVFCVLVLLDNPQKAGQSHDAGISAVPVFREIAAATAQYLEIPVEPSTEK